MPARYFALALLLSIGACSSGTSEEPPVACTTDSRPAMLVEVVDAVTGQGLQGATGTAVRTDGYTETITALPPYNTFGVVFEGLQPVVGTWSLTVRRAGYADWTRNSIEVRMADQCHVETVRILAQMVPLPPT